MAGRFRTHLRSNVIRARPGSGIAACVVLASLVVVPSAAGATRYAEPGGNGPEPCLQTDPCDIRNAVEGTTSPTEVNDGDEVELLPGTHTVTGFALDISKAIVVRGQAGAPRPTINPTAAGDVGVRVRPAATLRRVAVEYAGSFAAIDSDGTVEQVVAHASGATGSGCTVFGGTIRDSVCWGEGAGQYGVGLNTSGGVASIKLRNVTAVASGPTNTRGIMLSASSGAQLTIDAKGVIAQGTTHDVWGTASNPGSSATISFENSNYETVHEFGNDSGTATVTPPGTGTNQTAAPQFVSAATGDFHQAAGSPTIDAGALDLFSGTTDFEGQARTQGTAPDIGADEFAPPPPPPPGDTTPPPDGTTPPPDGTTPPPDGTAPPTGPGEFTRALSLSYSEKKDKFKGKLTSQASDCIADQQVKVYEKAKGKDPKLGSASTNDAGKYSLKEKNAGGKFYANAKERSSSTGTCLAAKSETIKVD